MACNQDQIKKFPWSPERVAALFGDVRENYISKGITDFPEIVKGLSANYGLKPEIIVKGLSRPEGSIRRMADDMWLKAQRQRTLEQKARAMVPQMEIPKWKDVASKVLNFPRRVTLFGHFAAFTKSHLSDQLFYNPSEYAKNFKQSWALLTKGGRAAHEAEITTLFSDADPRYIAAKRAGLDNRSGGEGTFARETAEVTGRKQKPTSRVDLAFDQLRMTRQRIWNKEWSHLTPEERANPEGLKDLASVVNHDTGATARSNAAFRFMFLSPRLFPAQLAHVFKDVPKALIETGMGVRWNKAAPAARYVARKTAILVGAQAALLAANEGYYLATNDERFKPNLTKLRYDFLRPRLFGYSVPISPTIELAKVPFVMMAAGMAARKGDNRLLAALQQGLKTALGRQNPLFSIIEEGVTGQNAVTGRPIPAMPSPVNKALPVMGEAPATRGKPTQEWTEYLGSKMPIFMANYAREFYDELQGQGMSTDKSKSIIRAAVTGTIEAITSYHLSPDHGQNTQIQGRPHKTFSVPRQRVNQTVK